MGFGLYCERTAGRFRRYRICRLHTAWRRDHTGRYDCRRSESDPGRRRPGSICSTAGYSVLCYERRPGRGPRRDQRRYRQNHGRPYRKAAGRQICTSRRSKRHSRCRGSSDRTGRLHSAYGDSAQSYSYPPAAQSTA